MHASKAHLMRTDPVRKTTHVLACLHKLLAGFSVNNTALIPRQENVYPLKLKIFFWLRQKEKKGKSLKETKFNSLGPPGNRYCCSESTEGSSRGQQRGKGKDSRAKNRREAHEILPKKALKDLL